MSHQDDLGHTASAPHHQALHQALDWLVSPADLGAVAFRPECTWTPKGLIFAAILWAWSDETTLTARFARVRKVVLAMAILTAWPAHSYQAFLKLLRTWTATLTVALITAFRRRMQTDLAARFLIGGFAVFGADGSRLELPRTASNQARFAATPKSRPARAKSKAKAKAARAEAAHRKKVHNPQMWLTTMFHLGMGLPWDWRTGPSDSSERDHLKQMLAALPAGALIAADAGFAGYETWKAILESRRHLLIRVGANVRLLRGLGYAHEERGVVYLWPAREAARSQPPLVLRLVVVHGGRHPVYLVTSVLEESELSAPQVIEIYALRWGVELFYRHFKQTFARRKLRSHAADNAELEANWSLIGLWALCLHGQVALQSAGVPARRVSVAKLLYAYRHSLRDYQSRPEAGESLSELVQAAVIDAYHRRHKSSRDYPRKKHEHAIGEPEIRHATEDQINAARKIRDRLALGLTA